MLDDGFVVAFSGAERNQVFDLVVATTGLSGTVWSASQKVKSDNVGRLRIDAGSIVEALQPIGESTRDDSLAGDIDGEVTLKISVARGQRQLGSIRAVRRVGSSNLALSTLLPAQDGIAGRHWRISPRSGLGKPAVLLLGGSEGGYAGDAEARLLASRGYPALSLAYFGVDGLPPQLRRIPLEYFHRALSWLASGDSGGDGRVMVVGASRGAELALILASTYPDLVSGVAAYAPSSVVNPAPGTSGVPAWTFRGKPLVSVRPDELGTASPSNNAAVIPVERIRGPVLIVSGVSDLIWPAANYASSVARRRADHGLRTIELASLEAGHGVAAVLPLLPAALGFSRNGAQYDFGGNRAADAHLRTQAWDKLLRLLPATPSGKSK